jgi:hypothetical protein
MRQATHVTVIVVLVCVYSSGGTLFSSASPPRHIPITALWLRLRLLRGWLRSRRLLSPSLISRRQSLASSTVLVGIETIWVATGHATLTLIVILRLSLRIEVSAVVATICTARSPLWLSKRHTSRHRHHQHA